MRRSPLTETRSDLSSLLAPETPPKERAPIPPPARPGPAPQPAPPPSPYSEFLGRPRFGSLDGLRAFGMLVVIGHHVAGGPGRVGASLFFLISGFLITTILIRERTRRGTIALVPFRSRRARRLFPLYFAVLLAYAILVGRIEPPGQARDAFFAHLPAFATLTSNLFVPLDGGHVIFYFAWSLAAQEQFYLVWPWLLKRWRTTRCVLALASVLGLVYATRSRLLDDVVPSGSAARALVLSVMPTLLLGSLLALALRGRTFFRMARALLGSRWAAPVLMALTVVLWQTPGVPEPALHASLAGLLAACVVREDHLLAPLLRWAPIAHIGAVSYGVYLFHMLCHHAVQAGLRPLGLDLDALDFLGTALLSVALATLSQRHFESWFLRRPPQPAPAQVLS